MEQNHSLIIDTKENNRNSLIIPTEEHFILHYLKLKGIRSKLTSQSYATDILYFFKALDTTIIDITDITLDNVREVNLLHVQRWIMFLKDIGFSSATISRKNSALSSLYNWLLKMGAVRSNPFANMSDELPKVNSKETECLSNQEVARLLLIIDGNNLADIRDKAIITLIITTAIRKSELLNIKLKDIIVSGNFNLIRILGKGSKEDAIKLRPDVKKNIDTYLKMTGRTYSDKESYLFGSIKENSFLKPMNKNSLNKIITVRCKAANIYKNITVHSLRHTAITLVVQSNKFTIEQVRDFARHNSIVTTNRYIHNQNKYENYCGDIIEI